VALYLPALRAPAGQGGDMIGLFYVLASVAMTGGVLVGSAVAGLVVWLRLRAKLLGAGLLSAPLIHVVFVLTLGWREYMPFLPVP
jgi:hypothetical protein